MTHGRRQSPLAFLLVMLMLTARIYAWSGEGHQVIALIAEEHLSEEAKAGIQELLGNDVDISDAEIASWADQTKRERKSTAPWHFVNIPLDAKTYDPKRDGRDGNNLVDRVSSFATVLEDSKQPKEVRAEALKFIVHLVGDIHQPLHCAQRGDDKGGNQCLVWMPNATGKPSNLHAVWDTTLLRSFVGRTRIAEYSANLDKQITVDQVKAWSAGSPESWANESHDVAAAQAYKDVPEGKTNRLTQKYVDESKPVIEKQLQRGGIRLAVILNRVFTPRPSTQPAR